LTSPKPASETIALNVDSPAQLPGPQPVCAGVPLPQGLLSKTRDLALMNPAGKPALFQSQPLARWPDGSIRWLLLDFVLPEVPSGTSRWTLQIEPRSSRPPAGPKIAIDKSSQGLKINTGTALFIFDPTYVFWPRVFLDEAEALDTPIQGLLFTDRKGQLRAPQRQRVLLEAAGPVRATVLLEGTFCRVPGCFWSARLSFFAGTGLLRVDFTIRNTRRARHRGGIWDLGDHGSLFFRDLTLELALPAEKPPTSQAVQSFVQLPYREIRYLVEPGQPVRSAEATLEIYQDSSGGDNWQSRNHVNHQGRVPCSFRGYRLRSGGDELIGGRASPVVALERSQACLTTAVPDFWQQFPKAIEVDDRCLRLRLFPGQAGDLFELQGGEQKTHTAWLSLDAPGPDRQTLHWVHQPARVLAADDWLKKSGAFPDFGPPAGPAAEPCQVLLREAIEGKQGLAAKRETIDEYGWRHYGDVYADHEAEHYQGPLPVISHYNNQYDLLNGCLRQWLHTGDRRWADLALPLARHVIDIDIYHTDEDRPAYNGGLFWHTDHYRDAALATHRAYSRRNAPKGRPYGGGPCNEHNYTTGLLHYYFLTGDATAREAVLSLAHWVLHMDDGRLTLFGLIDDGPTGLATATREPGYHGPGRGAGNSVNALLDAWILTGQRSYVESAERLIRRTVHPEDDVVGRNLVRVEDRWSYTVFLSVLARYLNLKAEAGEVDETYAYGRESLLRYASWMLLHERRYLDRPEELEYPTETWAAQELRKANVLRLAAAHADEALAGEMRRKGDELAERAWKDLMAFDTRSVTRAIALVLGEGTRDLFLRSEPARPAPRPKSAHSFDRPENFIPQRRRVMNQWTSPAGLLRSCLKLASPARWRRYWQRRRDP
jgi:hypothetical protein